MKLKNIVLIVTILSLFNGCYSKIPSYEAFVYNNNWNICKSHIPKLNQKFREIYSEDKYIYRFEKPKGCYYGYLTNRDDKPDKVIGWIIISGEEFCKDIRAIGEII